MKTLNLLATVIILDNFTGAAMADDADDVRATIERHYAAIHTGDIESVLSHHLEDF